MQHESIKLVVRFTFHFIRPKVLFSEIVLEVFFFLFFIYYSFVLVSL